MGFGYERIAISDIVAYNSAVLYEDMKYFISLICHLDDLHYTTLKDAGRLGGS
jgi:hypothetical protein